MRMIATGIALAVLLLTGCSGIRLVDSDVNAFSSASAPALAVPASYRFERLPSQQAQAQRSTALEALAQTELAKVGLSLDNAAPQYSVHIDMHMFRDPQAPWDDPRYVAGYFTPFPVVTRFGTVMQYPSLTMHFDFPYFRREIMLVVRRISDGQVVFETRANHDGRWPDDAAVLPAMFQAALQNFPNPPAGLRHISIEIPR